MTTKTKPRKLTRSRVDAVCRAIGKQLGATPGQSFPSVLQPGQASVGHTDTWRITWEDGPKNWAYSIEQTGWRAVFLEPFCGFALEVVAD